MSILDRQELQIYKMEQKELERNKSCDTNPSLESPGTENL